MRLRRLELHGFKTFASRATLEFAPGITAVVGPNGSGKSNLAEAVRWVLGEQSARQLRGRRSEDVIFGGGQQRAPQGMAEVTLILEDGEGRLPAGMAEAAVGRRLYRTGESEYYVNRARVRLRDVVDLLARSGVGQQGHAVIGQGQVDLALSLRPEERRGLFEDAAGVRRYQLKRDEAEARLAEVHTNATRIADLIAELEPRLAQLQRQARRAQEEARLRQRWREALQAWLGHQRWEQQQARAELEALEGDLARARLSAEGQVSAAGEAERAAGLALQSLEGDLARWEAARETAREALATARRELAVHRERRGAAERATADLEAERERLEGRTRAAAAARGEAEQELQRAGAAVERAKQAAAAALAELQAAGAEGGGGEDAGAERTLQEARRTAGDAARAVTQVTTQLRELERQQEGFERQVVEAAEGQSRAGRSLEQTGSRLAGLEEAGSAAQERLARAQGARSEAARARAETQARLETLSARAATLDREAEGLRARLDVLDSLLCSGERRARRPGSQAPDEDREGDGERLAVRLHVPGDLEAAVAAAAGEALEWELVPGTGEARRRAQALAAGGERTTFVAVDRLADALAPDAPGSLYEAVTQEAPPDSAETDLLRRAVLGQFDLAPDLATALDALETGRRPAVTRTGEAVSPPGASSQGVLPLGTVTAGAPPGQATLLQRVRERRDAAGLLESSVTARAALEVPLAESRERLRTVSEEERRLEGESRTLAQQVSREEGERRALSQQLARLEGDVRWWGEFATRAGAQRASLAERLATLKAQVGETQQRHAQATRDVQDLTAAAQRRQTRLARLRENEGAARTALSLAQGRLDQARQRRAAAAGAADAAQGDLHALLARTEQAHQTASALRQQEPERAQRVATLEAEGGTGAQRGEALRAAASRERARREEAALAARKARDDLAGAQARGAALQERRMALAEREETLQAQALRELGDLPPPAPGPSGAASLRTEVETLDRRLHGMGPVNQVALQEHAEASERLTFLKQQLDDLNGAAAALAAARAELDAGLEADFVRTFEAVAEAFRGTFTRLFNGGEAELRLTDPGNVAGTGIEIIARLPGKRRQELALLSGGERALAACALLFALLEARPSPFCILDEVDAALDEANVGRFCDALEDLSQATQFVLITHNRATMERAGALYGVTLGEDGVSRVLSLRLADAVRLVGAPWGPHPSRASSGAPAGVEPAQRATPGGVQQASDLGRGENGASPHTVHSVPPAPDASANAT